MIRGGLGLQEKLDGRDGKTDLRISWNENVGMFYRHTTKADGTWLLMGVTHWLRLHVRLFSHVSSECSRIIDLNFKVQVQPFLPSSGRLAQHAMPCVASTLQMSSVTCASEFRSIASSQGARFLKEVGRIRLRGIFHSTELFCHS